MTIGTQGARRWVPLVGAVLLVVALLVVMAAAATVGTPTAGAAPAGPDGAAPAAVPVAGRTVPTVLVPLTPCRLLDTRHDEVTTSVLPVGTRRISLAGRCGVPAEATAVGLVVTVTEGWSAGHVEVVPAGTGPRQVSTANWSAGETRANGALVTLGDAQAIDIHLSSAAQVVIDVTSAFVPAETSSAGRFVPIEPARALDTRRSGGPLGVRETRRVPLPTGVPSDAVAVAATITTTDAPGPGFLTAHPAGSPRPTASVLNTDAAGQTRASGAVVAVAPGGLDIHASVGGHLVVDVTGWFTGPSAPVSGSGRFVPALPARVLDTRHQPPRVWPGGTLERVPVDGPAGAVALNATMLADGAGHLTLHPARRPRPPTSSVNATSGDETVAALAVVPVSSAGVAVFSSGGAEVILDRVGWFTGDPAVALESPAVNDPPPGSIGCVPQGTPMVDGVAVHEPSDIVRRAHVPAVGPRGPLAMVGDSLTWVVADELAAALAADGWGPVCVDGGISRRVSLGSDRVPSGLTKIGEVSATHPVWRLGGAAWVLALGTNDVGHTATSTERVDAEIDRAVAAVGFRRGLWWVNVGTARTEPWSVYEAVWNAPLDLDGRLGVVDWHAASSGRREYFISDLVHLTPLGYEVRSDLLVADLADG